MNLETLRNKFLQPRTSVEKKQEQPRFMPVSDEKFQQAYDGEIVSVDMLKEIPLNIGDVIVLKTHNGKALPCIVDSLGEAPEKVKGQNALFRPVKVKRADH